MQYSYALLALIGANSINALPLNINLGAYSPALVVGDGEISFDGAANAEALMNTLQSTGTSTAAAVASEGTTSTTRTQEASAAAAPSEGDSSVVITPAATTTDLSTAQGMGRARDLSSREPEADIEDTKVEKRDLAGFDRALTYAADALTKSPGVQLGTEGSGVGILVEAGGVKSGAAA